MLQMIESIGIRPVLQKSIKVRSEQESYFLQFSYNPEYVAKIKTLPIRHWHPDLCMWEIPKRHLEDLYNLFYPKETQLQVFESKLEMMPHQLDTLEYALTNKSFINGDWPGCGKTKQSLDVAVYRKNYENVKHCLIIVAVSNLRANWEYEVRKHTYEASRLLGFNGKTYSKVINRLDEMKNVPNEFFWISNSETLRMPGGFSPTKKFESELAKKVRNGEHLTPVETKYVNRMLPYQILTDLYESGQLGLIIVDEFHELRNPNNLATKTLFNIPLEVPKILLSGTPVVKGPQDLYVPLKLLGVEDRPYGKFKSAHTQYTLQFGKYLPSGSYRNLEQLSKTVGRYMIRRNKDMLDLPPKIIEEEVLEMTPEEERIYRNVLMSSIEDLDVIIAEQGITNTKSNALYIRLRQITSNIDSVTTKVEESTKLNRCISYIKEYIKLGKKLIVYSSFRRTIHFLYEKLAMDDDIKEYMEQVEIVQGGMKDKELEDVKHKFQNDDGFGCILGVTSALKAGHTLAAAEMVIFLDMPFDRARFEQACDRAHRIGTVKTVVIKPLLYKGTVDIPIYIGCANRGALSDHIIDKQELLLYKTIVDILQKRGEVIDPE